MNFRFAPLLRTTSLALALALPASLVAAEGNGEDSPLHQNMEAMGKTMRAINNGLKATDPGTAKVELLEALQKMQTLAVEGKTLVPAHIAKMPEAERPAKLTAYRSDLAAAIVVMLDLERAVLADNWEKARELYGLIRTARKEGHEKYNPEE